MPDDLTAARKQMRFVPRRRAARNPALGSCSNINGGTPIVFGLSSASLPSTLVVPNRETNTDPI